jgi:hypothetical protein
MRLREPEPVWDVVAWVDSTHSIAFGEFLYTDFVKSLVEILTAELERPRELSFQVVNHLCGMYGIDREAAGSFLVQELPGLEDYEIDLILSPLFTPKLTDQAVFAEALGKDAISRAQWPALIQQLVDRPTRAQLVTIDHQVHPVPLRAVTIERYVHRLRLDGNIPESTLELIDRTPAADRAMLKAVARRAVFEDEARRGILVRYLTQAESRGGYRLSDAVDLLNLVESYRPKDVGDVLARIPPWQQGLRSEINASGSKPFFNQRIEEEHGGGRDQRHHDHARVSAKQNELEFLDRLLLALSD